MKKFCVMAVFCLLALPLFSVDLLEFRRIICLGDSITHGGNYYQWLQLDLLQRDGTVPRHVLNRGISGDTVDKMLKRLPAVIEEDKPDCALIMVGINNIIGINFSDAKLAGAMDCYPVFEKYERLLKRIVRQLQEHGIAVILLTPPPYNEFESKQIRAPLLKNLDSVGVKTLDGIVEKVSRDCKVECIDIATPLRRNLLRQPAVFPRGTADRVHPSRQGEENEHLLMAEIILNKKIQIPGSDLMQKLKNLTGIQQKRQTLCLVESRVPDVMKTEEEKISWYVGWVSRLPDQVRPKEQFGIGLLKKRKELHMQYRRDYVEAHRMLYEK